MNYYEAWGYPVYEPEMGDSYSEVSYVTDFDDIDAEFKVDFISGNWVDDFTYYTGWEDYGKPSSFWYGEYGEMLVSNDKVWETVRDAVADEVGVLKDGSYIISAKVKFSVDVQGLWVGYKPENDGEIVEDNVEANIVNVQINNLRIERI